MLTEVEKNFYQKQLNIFGMKNQGQEKLKQAKVLIVGAGGLGHPVATYLSAAGVGTIGIVDFDFVCFSNLHRQVQFTQEDLNKNKAYVLLEKIKKINPFIEIISYPIAVDEKTISEFSIIVDCTDNFTTKFFLHDTCFQLKKTLIQGSIAQWEGTLHTFNFNNQTEPCLRCLYPQTPEEACVNNCDEAGVMGSTAGVFGTLMSSEVIKAILGISNQKNGESFIFDLISLQNKKITWKKNLICPLHNHHSIHALHPFEIDSSKIAQGDYQWIDIREMQIEQLSINKEDNIILYCNLGKKSLKYTTYLRENGYSNIWSLKGGRLALHANQSGHLHF